MNISESQRIILDITPTVRYATEKRAETFIIVEDAQGRILLRQPLSLQFVDIATTISTPTPKSPTKNNGF